MSYSTVNEIELSNYPILHQEQNLGKARYLHIPTIDPANVLIENGWQPREVISINPRVEYRKGFQKHRVRFFNPELPMVNNSIVELLLTNSYDGKSAFQLELGIFRMVCANGLVAGETFSKETVRHLGYNNDKVYNAISNLLPETKRIIDAVQRFSKIKLTQKEAEDFGFAILHKRLDSLDKWIFDDFSIQSLLKARRWEDNNDSLWGTFNCAQENLTKHGFYCKIIDPIDKQEKIQKVQALKNTFRSDPLNKTLWDLTEKLAERK